MSEQLELEMLTYFRAEVGTALGSVVFYFDDKPQPEMLRDALYRYSEEKERWPKREKVGFDLYLHNVSTKFLVSSGEPDPTVVRSMGALITDKFFLHNEQDGTTKYVWLMVGTPVLVAKIAKIELPIYRTRQLSR